MNLCTELPKAAEGDRGHLFAVCDLMTTLAEQSRHEGILALEKWLEYEEASDDTCRIRYPECEKSPLTENESYLFALLLRMIIDGCDCDTVRDRKNYGEMDVAKRAFPKFQKKLEICRNLFFGYDYTPFYEGSDLQRGMTISGAVNFIVAPDKEEQKQAFIKEALMFKKLIDEQVKVYKRTNLVKSEAFSELIQQTLNRYLNGMLTNDDNGALKVAEPSASATARLSQSFR